MDRPTLAEVRRRADRLVGAPFQIGGRSASGLDCIGLLLDLFEPWAEIPDPRRPEAYTASEIDGLQSHFLRLPSLGDLQPLDVIHLRRRAQHVAICEGDEYVVHATEQGVVRSRIADVVTPQAALYRLKRWALEGVR